MVTAEHISVVNTATLLAASDRGGVQVRVKNKGANPVFLGGSDVAATTGFEIVVNAVEQLLLAQGEELYAIASGTETVHVLRVGDELDRSASLTTTCAGTNNDLVFSAVAPGPAGNLLRVRYVVSGNNTALAVTVSAKDISVAVATDGGGAATSTAADIAAAIAADSGAHALVLASNAALNDGTGVVAAFAYTNLSGGA